MKTRQQKEALKYFRKNAVGWQTKGKIDHEDKVNVIQQRNDFVLNVITHRKKTGLALDIGCGTGDLVCEMASRGVSAVGIDFSKEMIELAIKQAKKSGLENARFECCSVFDFVKRGASRECNHSHDVRAKTKYKGIKYCAACRATRASFRRAPCDRGLPRGKYRFYFEFKPNMYDVISANGLIEYISYTELDKLFDFSLKVLRKGGSLVLGSRNRLFNIFSLNEFTASEIREGSADALLRESLEIVKKGSIKKLIGFKTAPLQKETIHHKYTGIKVKTRYQFTPAQLVNIAFKKGFSTVGISPIHIHGVVPKFKTKNQEVSASIGNLLQFYREDPSLLPQASSFMIHLKKLNR